MPSRRAVWSQFALVVCVALVSCWPAFGQDDPSTHRGRKYKAPPATSHIEVTVVKKFNGKPIMNAAVIFNSTMDGKEEGNLEVKTDPEGKATIDVIATGSTVSVQVIATGFATYAQSYVIADSTAEIAVSMQRPQEQLSSYENNEGKAASRKAGVQEPIRTTPIVPPAASTAPAAATPSPSSSTPAAPKQ